MMITKKRILLLGLIAVSAVTLASACLNELITTRGRYRAAARFEVLVGRQKNERGTSVFLSPEEMKTLPERLRIAHYEAVCDAESMAWYAHLWIIIGAVLSAVIVVLAGCLLRRECEAGRQSERK